jgi:hypothetical protein
VTSIEVDPDADLMERRSQDVAGVIDLSRTSCHIMRLAHHQIVDLLQVS